MALKWLDERCILCTLGLEERRLRHPETAQLTEEHVIPKAVGGRLVCDFLCKACNDHLGVLEANLKTDARIRLAIENLQDELPDLYASMSENQAYIAQSANGSLKAKLKRGEIRLDSSRREDGSILGPLSDARRAIKHMLLRRHSSNNEITVAMNVFEESPEDLRVEIAKGISIEKKSIDGFYPVLQLAAISLPLLKIGYEYLTLELGTRIFDKYFDSVRSALSSRRVLPDCCAVEAYRLTNSIYSPFHGLCATNTLQGLTVRILLFGYLSYHVEFSKLQLPSPAGHLYTVDLRNGTEECDIAGR